MTKPAEEYRDLMSQTRGNPGIRIAFLDGPVDSSHACFVGARLLESNTHTADDKAPGGGDAAHGTHVVSVVLGQTGSAVEGLAPDCTGISIPIYSATRDGGLACSQLDLARAINLALNLDAHIINISGGEFSTGGRAEPFLAQSLQACADRGVLVIAAAGNNGCNCVHLPAAEPTVIAVGAMDQTGKPQAFSNWGDAYRHNGLLAPGTDILGARPGGGTETLSGTSFAVPIITGIAALFLSLASQAGLTLRPTEIGSALLRGARPCQGEADSTNQCLAGRLSVPQTRALLPPAISSKNTTPELPQPKQLIPSITQPSKGNPTMTSETQAAESTASPQVAAEAAPETQALTDLDTASVTPAQAPTPDAGIQPAACDACASDAAIPPTLVYGLGQLGVDFGTEARRDQLAQLSGRDVDNPIELLDFLDDEPTSASSVIWTLSLDSTAIYSIMPIGPFAASAYQRLQSTLRAQLTEGVERVSVPGLLNDSITLLNGQQVPTILLDVRGMFSWTTDSLVDSVAGKPPTAKAELVEHERKVEGIHNFLDRVYYEVRNLGNTPQERAINYAATNAFQLEYVYREAALTGMKLDSITAQPSPICRPGSECWDVLVTFFNPAKRLEQARHVHRFTVDVSDVIPVTVGPVRHWDVY